MPFVTRFPYSPACDVITVGILFLFHDLANHNRTVGAGIDRDLARRGLDRLTHDLDTMLLILIFGAQAFKCLDRAEQGYAATRQNAFLDSGASCMHRVIDPIFALLYFSLSRSADADYRYSACEFSQRFFAGTTNDRGVVLVDRYCLRATEHTNGHLLQLYAEIFRYRLATGEDRGSLIARS